MVLASGSEAVAGIAQLLQKLTPAQRSFLRLRYYYETDAECARAVGIAPKTVATWKDRDKNFVAAYEELLTQPLLHSRAELLLLTGKAIHALGEMLDSTNPQARAAAIDRVLKGRDAQLLTNNIKVESDGDDLYMELMRRLAARTQTVRPTTVEPPAGEVREAEWHEVPPASETSETSR